MPADAESAEAGSVRARRGPPGGPAPEGGALAKPSLSYIALIAQAILASPAQKLNLASIYADVEARFPYYRARGQGWKNSVRHNLSLNDCFVKLGRCEDGKGSYWAVHPGHRARFLRGDFRQHRKASRSRRARGMLGGDAGGELARWGAPPCPGHCPQCLLQLQWVSLPPPPLPLLPPPPLLPPLCPPSWSLAAPGDAGRWGYRWLPWRPPGWGVGDSALGGVGGLCCSPCFGASPPGLGDAGYPWTYVTDPAYPV